MPFSDVVAYVFLLVFNVLGIILIFMMFPETADMIATVAGNITNALTR